jgi:hypothetical protein
MGVGPHEQNAGELGFTVEAGMPSREAIKAATVNAAKLLDLSDEVGSIASGKSADVIAVDFEPPRRRVRAPARGLRNDTRGRLFGRNLVAAVALPMGVRPAGAGSAQRGYRQLSGAGVGQLTRVNRGPLRCAVLKCSVREQISEARRAVVTCFPRRSSCRGSAFEPMAFRGCAPLAFRLIVADPNYQRSIWSSRTTRSWPSVSLLMRY